MDDRLHNTMMTFLDDGDDDDDNDNDDDDDDDDDDEDSNGYPATGAQGQGFILCQKKLTLLEATQTRATRFAPSISPSSSRAAKSVGI